MLYLYHVVLVMTDSGCVSFHLCGSSCSCVHYCDCKGTARLCRFASRRTKLQLLQRVFQRMLTNYLLIYAILTFKTAAVPFHQDYRQESPRSCERGLSMSFPAPLRPKQVRAKLPKCLQILHHAAILNNHRPSFLNHIIDQRPASSMKTSGTFDGPSLP